MLQGCYIIGIDPGVPVTMAMLDPQGKWVAHAKPRPAGATPKNDVFMFADVLKKWQKHVAKTNYKLVAVIEQVNPRPREGVVSVGKFMGSFWMAQAACAALDIPFSLISPRRWKPRLGLNDEKAKSVALAKTLFKESGRATWRLSKQKDHDFAEAALLAYYLRHNEPEPQLPYDNGLSITGI